jgi:hypothetical protein
MDRKRSPHKTSRQNELSQKSEKIHISVKFKECQQEITAEPQEAWLWVNHFFKDFIPTFEMARKLFLTVDLQQLAKELSGIVAFSAEGVNFLVPKNRLTDNEALSIWLTAYYLGGKLGVVNCDSLSKDELQVKLGKTSKITSTRLGELTKNDLTHKTADEKYRITTFGLFQTQREIIPKIKQKLAI